MGSLFSQRLVGCSAHDFSCWTKSNRVSIVASSPSGLMDYRALTNRLPAALMVGSEKHGLSEQLLETADFVVRIPMHETATRLSVTPKLDSWQFASSGCHALNGLNRQRNPD